MRELFQACQEIARKSEPAVLPKAAFRCFRNRARVVLLSIKFRSLSRSATDVKSAADLAFSFKYLGKSIVPLQIRDEIVGLLTLVESMHPKVVMEIGTANGGTLFMFTRAADKDSLLISIDLPEGPFGGGYPFYLSRLFQSFRMPGQQIFLIRGDSHETATREKIERILNGQKVDFLLIDGDHTYEGVRKDFETYSSFVRKGGVVALHDICRGPPESVGGVPEFWLEVREKYRSMSIVSNPSQSGLGIGVLYV